ncbi:anthranilate synthase component II [Staphylococcus argenteus]|uniref:anthranilate synthase component II n=1 Tax=Staphylococcus argenteus TaxID=985002 RepID=UPI000504DC44|nr:aminodeoxychorismate/anthranilate synthase component II [Staphylococcus argenteus]MBE2134742.1 aminodeoxychorismate/anthranilate synthase component II [Staphylococcus argenteus]MBE2146149.1 aminodeoxychorismate/anthranilate synthase component II [Staphylococcus argenteus]MBE2162043.1 aminodeoxychorismate/anthranilate synthase component II [Staphylococcus argenteus]MCG9797367.1 aminodeoxychorismate/anthranilate synthase component II [Staphylococcus argenteus]MCG9800004.1 aminodeoxychorismate
MILVIDNNDSFTYNLIDYIKTQTKLPVEVIGIDSLVIEQVINIAPQAIVISPGPGKPDDYPSLYKVIKNFHKQIPILGVCLGFQCIVSYFGGRIIHSRRPVHGHTTQLQHLGVGIFKGIPQNFNVMRYHSLIAEQQSFPKCLTITATNDENIIMGLEHQSYPTYGVQYHPESILSEYGYKQVELFLAKVCENSENRI